MAWRCGLSFMSALERWMTVTTPPRAPGGPGSRASMTQADVDLKTIGIFAAVGVPTLARALHGSWRPRSAIGVPAPARALHGSWRPRSAIGVPALARAPHGSWRPRSTAATHVLGVLELGARPERTVART
jgi:hypothetical protein